MRLKMGLLWCEFLIKSSLTFAWAKHSERSKAKQKAMVYKRGAITVQGFPRSIVLMPIGSGKTKRLLGKLTPLCLGIAFSDATSVWLGQSPLANAVILTSLPQPIEIQANQLATNQPQKACSLDTTTPHHLHQPYYYWFTQNPCLKAKNPESALPKVAALSDDATTTLWLELTSELITPQPLKAALPVQNSPESASEINQKNLFPLLSATNSGADTQSEGVQPFGHENNLVAQSPESLPLISSVSTKEKAPLQKPLIFQGAALLAGNYQQTANKFNEFRSRLSPIEASALLPGVENPQTNCPPPLIACAPSVQAQNPPVPSAPPVSPENLQPNPNQDRFLQPPPTPAPIKPDATPPVQPPPTPAPGVQPSPSPNAPSIQVQKINVTGSTVFSPEQINPIVKPFEGRALTLEQLREVADAITQLYLNQGYITSRALIVDQAVSNGVVEIRVLEGSLEDIKIEGTRRVKPNYIRSRVQLGAKTPLNTAALEDQLRLLRADPLFENVEASLRAGKLTGQSILIVRVIEANPFEGSVSVDNYSPPSVGSERLGANLLYRNLTGNGDAIGVSGYHTTNSGADSLELSYRLPVNAMNGALQLRTSLSRNAVVDSAFSFLDIQGDSQLYEISFQQPLIRSPREEFSLSLGFAFQESKATSVFGSISPGADIEGITKTSVIKFGQDYLRRDVRGAWSLRSLFSFGTGLFDATTNSAPLPSGQFVSWLGQVQRVQVLGENNFLIAGFDVQLTPDRLLPSQQFVIGGGQSLRGYRQNIRSGDNGVRLSIEDRITLERNESGVATFQLAPFFDSGVVWNNDSRNRPLPADQFLAGIGLGLIWEPIPKLSLRLDYGYPLIDIKDKGTNAQDEGFYFNVRYQF